jgi:hypothetical protein
MKIDQKLEIEKLLQLPVVDRPRRIAELVHRIQVDKAGRAYIDHPRRVAENVQQLPGFDHLPSQEQADAVAAAWLHDVIEDSGDEAWPKVTQVDLVGWGISERAAEIAELLTRKDDVTDDIYYARIKADPLARMVKIADITDNCNRQRIIWLLAAGGSDRSAKYELALAALGIDDSEENVFWYRTNQACEVGGFTEVSQYTFGARYDESNKPFALYCMNKGNEQWLFDQECGGWIPDDSMFELIIAGVEDFEIVTLGHAMDSFPTAFPMSKVEEENHDRPS